MTGNRSILSLRGIALLFACALGCGLPSGAGPGDRPPEGKGRVVVGWQLDGAILDAARCQAERISYMEVEVHSAVDDTAVFYTQVRCDLDRYTIFNTPEGPVVIGVLAVGKDSKGNECARYYGEARTTAGTSTPQAATPVALRVVGRGC